MMPQVHLVVGAVVSAAIWPFLGDDGAISLVAWALVGGAVGAVIDMDIMVIVAAAARGDASLRRWTDPRNVGRDFKGFIGMLRSRGLLRKAAVTHLAMGAALVGAFWLLVPSLLVPAVVGAFTHLVSDLQYLSPPAL